MKQKQNKHVTYNGLKMLQVHSQQSKIVLLRKFHLIISIANHHVPLSLRDCKFVFIRFDGVRFSPQNPYEVFFELIEKSSKYFITLKNDTIQNISIDRNKSAFWHRNTKFLNSHTKTD